MTIAPYFTHLTGSQRWLLARLMRGGIFVRGADVRVARSLVKKGLVTLEDNGSLGGSGNTDGERWFVSKVVPA